MGSDTITTEPEMKTDNYASEPVDIQDNQQIEATETSADSTAVNAEGTTTDATETNQHYEPEEMRNMCLEDIDINRIPPELKKHYNSMRAAHTKAFQALAEERRQLDQMRQQQPAQQLDAKELAYRSYMNNPLNFLDGINREIMKLRGADPLDDDYRHMQGQATLLENLRSEFEVRARSETDRNRNYQEFNNRLNVEIMKAVPEFDKKAPALQKFAKETLGMSNNLISACTDINRMGMFVPEILGVINKMYTILNVDKKIRDGSSPPRGVPPGRGNIKMQDGEVARLEKKAQESGSTADIAAHYAALKKQKNRS